MIYPAPATISGSSLPSSLPSARECLARVAVLAADTASIAASIEELNAEVWRDDPAPELSAAVQRLRELHTLADQLARNLRGGYGVSATPAAGSKPARVVAHTAAHTAASTQTSTETPTQTTRGPAAPAPLPAHLVRPRASPTQQPAPPGHLSTDGICTTLGRSRGWLDKVIADGRFPPPAQRLGKRLYWTIADVQTFGATLPAKWGRP